MYRKFHYDQKGEKHSKLGANKVSGEDTGSRSMLGQFQKS